MKTYSLFMILIMLISGSVWASNTSQAKNVKTIVMVINEGFWAPEYYEPRAIFDHDGYQITVAGEVAGLIHPDSRNTEFAAVRADITYEQIDISKYDAITFAGGNGAWTSYFPNPVIYKVLAEAFAKKDMITALLCSSTGLLGVANNFDGKSTPIAKGRHVTGYYRVVALLKNIGQVSYDAGEKDKPFVVVDKNLITGRDPMSAELFGREVSKKLKQQL